MRGKDYPGQIEGRLAHFLKGRRLSSKKRRANNAGGREKREPPDLKFVIRLTQRIASKD